MHFEILKEAQKNEKVRNEFIEDNIGFIYKCTSKTIKRFVDKSDDEYQEALIAFNEAIMTYKEEKGNFYSYANLIIHSRIVDYLRKKKNNVIPFCSMSTKNDNDEDVEFDVEDEKANNIDIKIEIQTLTEELKKFDISFFDLAKSSPKSKSTKKACNDVILYIVNNKILITYLEEKKCLPVKQILDNLKVNKKIPERYRKYIIAGVIIISENYEIISEYFNIKR